MLCRLLCCLSLGLSCLAGLLCAACGPASPPGEVVLLVSTDLAVPTDVDTLHVTVTRSSDQSTLSDDCYALGAPSAAPSPCRTASLPGSLALISSDKARGRVLVHLELRLGGASGAVRVERDAELQIPTEGVKQLPMALDFLCSTAALPEACAAGLTCQAGSCVDDRMTDLADYIATPAGECFDVTACFGVINSANSTVPQEDPDLQQCSVRGSQALGAVNINVALSVNPAAVGNYGVCDAASGTCLIPLAPGPEGWRTLNDRNGQPIAIGLPEAVCAAVGKKSVLGVVIAPSTQCATKNEAAALCPAAPICVPATGICPPDWSGFSCSGMASPSAPPRSYCGEVAALPGTGPVLPGLWCCGDGSLAPPEPHDAFLIDDMSSGPLIKFRPLPDSADAAGGWFVGTDATNTVLSPAPYPALFTYRAIEPPATPAAGLTISHAACLRSDGFSGYSALEGFTFVRTPPDYREAPFDVSPYTGISFWAYAAPLPGGIDLPTEIRVQFPNLDTYTQRPTSTCMSQGRSKCDDFGEVLNLTSDWAMYTVKWADLKQLGFGVAFRSFDKNVWTTVFNILGPGPDSRSLPFDFCIAQIEFTMD